MQIAVYDASSFAVGSLLCASCIISGLLHFVRYSVLRQLKLWKRITGLKYPAVLNKARASRRFRVHFCCRSAAYLFTDIFLYYILAVVCAILCLVVHHSFFSFRELARS